MADLYSRRQFVAGLGGTALAALIASACGGGGGQGAAAGPAPTGTKAAPLRAMKRAASATRTVQHAKGDLEIPAKPKRIVMFEGTMNMLALGVLPVGARNIAREERNHPEIEELAGIFDLGGQELNVEEVVALEPDLIIGTSPSRDEIYGQLTRLAPTLLYDDSAVDRKTRWDEELLYFGTVAGEEEKASALLAAYGARLTKFKSLMGDRLGTTNISVLRVSSSGTKIYRGAFSGGVLEDAGLRRPPQQDLDAFQTNELTSGTDSEGFEISPERLREADSDVIFLCVNASSSPRGDEEKGRATRAAADALTAHPLWSRLSAVRAGQAFEVGGHWNGESIVDANKMLDDLFRDLLGGEPA